MVAGRRNPSYHSFGSISLPQALVPRRFDEIDMRVRLPSSTRARRDYVVVPDDGGDHS